MPPAALIGRQRVVGSRTRQEPAGRHRRASRRGHALLPARRHRGGPGHRREADARAVNAADGGCRRYPEFSRGYRYGVQDVRRVEAGRPGVFRDEAAREEARRRTEAMVDALRRSDVYEVASLLHNALEPVTTRLHPEVGELRERLLRAGALGAIMCGSGPSVFGLARDEGHAADIAARMGRSGLFIAACSFIGSGSRIMEKGRRS